MHTHLRGEELTQDDLTDLAMLRLDLMAAIDVDPETGLPGLVRSAHLLPLRAGELQQVTTSAPRLFSIFTSFPVGSALAEGLLIRVVKQEQTSA